MAESSFGMEAWMVTFTPREAMLKAVSMDEAIVHLVHSCDSTVTVPDHRCSNPDLSGFRCCLIYALLASFKLFTPRSANRLLPRIKPQFCDL
jgi:hypothetical protein